MYWPLSAARLRAPQKCHNWSVWSGTLWRILQLSDLHLGRSEFPDEQEEILSALVVALQRDCQQEGRPHLLTFTGDLFDSADQDPERTVDKFEAFLAGIFEALGGEIPTVLVPGNHDRRRWGLVAPFSTDLFDALAARMKGKVLVHGTTTPFLSQVVSPQFHGLPIWVVAYDSTFLPKGLISAGGVLRREDLLRAASVIGKQNEDWPVLFLLHHHLVPTPLTDVGAVEVDHVMPLLRWGVQRVLPALVANADREEMTMTALGSGTALSTLHSMGRAVIVLHGHKHYATARLLQGVDEDQGDVLLVSSGSTGVAQSWFPTTARDAARLWPSFNSLTLDGSHLQADVVSFGYRGEACGEIVRRPLAAADRKANRLIVRPVERQREVGGARELELNELSCHLSANLRHERWDCFCKRMYSGKAGIAPDSYGDTIDAIEDSSLWVLDDQGRKTGPALTPPTQVTLRRDRVLRYSIDRAYCRTVTEAHRMFGPRWAPYAWQGIMNRYPSKLVRLEVTVEEGAFLEGAFASETDLGNGQERPLSLSLESSDKCAVLSYENCPPRTLLRIYLPLTRT